MGDNTDGQLTDAMSEVAAALGVSAADCPDLAREILFENSVSSALQSWYKARMNVTPVAPVELVCAIAEVILTLEEQDPAALTSVDGVSEDGVSEIAPGVMDGLSQIGEEIEDRWFGRESLTEEEVYHRFVQ